MKTCRITRLGGTDRRRCSKDTCIRDSSKYGWLRHMCHWCSCRCGPRTSL